MNRIIKDWGVWCFLGLGISTLIFTIVIAWQCGEIMASIRLLSAQNQQSMEDREHLHRNQDLLRKKIEARP